MARKTHTVTGIVTSIDPVGMSQWGNPIYRVILADGQCFKTGVDAGVGYSITNHRPHSLTDTQPRVVLTLTDHNRIVGAQRA